MKDLSDPAKNLSPVERRVALMHSAGMGTEAIGIAIGTSSMVIGNILSRVHVQRHLLMIDSTYAQDMMPKAKKIHNMVLEATEEAVSVIIDTMKESKVKGEGESGSSVKFAQLAFNCAQDILDRTGMHAPKKVDIEGQVDHKHTHNIPAGLEAVATVLKEML